MKTRLIVSLIALFFTALPAFAGSFPSGTFDLVDNNLCQVSGWAKDPDSQSSIQVHIYKDGPYPEGQVVATIIADLLRPDLPYADKNHGFAYQFNAASGLYDDKDHQIYIYGIDATGDANILLNLSPKTIHCSSAAKTVNVKDFGAKGDGATDDSVAIQNAINSLPITGGVVNLPAGTYMLGTNNGSLLNYPNGQPILCAIKITKDNVTLAGNGTSSILKLMTGKKMRALCSTGNTNVIEKITIDGNAVQRASRDSTGQLYSWPDGNIVDGLVYLFGSSNSIVRDCEIRNGLEDGVGTWQTTGSVIQNCYVHNNGGFAYDPADSSNRAGANGIALNAGTGNKALNNRVEKNTYGILLAYGVQNATVDNNTISNNYGFGIQIGSSIAEQAGNLLNSGFTVTNNIISDNNAGGFSGIYVFGAQNGMVSANTIVNNLNVGLSINDETSISAYNSKNWQITNNTCSNNTPSRSQKFGMLISGRAQAITLTDNTCRDNGSSINDQIKIENPSSVNSNWESVNTSSYSPVSTSPPPSPTPASTSTTDTTIRLINDSGTFYLIQNNQKQGITNPDMLYTYGFEFQDALPPTNADLALPVGDPLLPADGSLVKSPIDSTVYLITSGQKKGFISASVFTALGFKFTSVLTITAPELGQMPFGSIISDSLMAHPDGFDINQDGTIYWINNQTKHGYPSMEVYNSWNIDNDFSRVVPANSADRSLPVGDVVELRKVQ